MKPLFVGHATVGGWEWAEEEDEEEGCGGGRRRRTCGRAATEEAAVALAGPSGAAERASPPSNNTEDTISRSGQGTCRDGPHRIGRSVCRRCPLTFPSPADRSPSSLTPTPELGGRGWPRHRVGFVFSAFECFFNPPAAFATAAGCGCWRVTTAVYSPPEA